MTCVTPFCDCMWQCDCRDGRAFLYAFASHVPAFQYFAFTSPRSYFSRILRFAFPRSQLSKFCFAFLLRVPPRKIFSRPYILRALQIVKTILCWCHYPLPHPSSPLYLHPIFAMTVSPLNTCWAGGQRQHSPTPRPIHSKPPPLYTLLTHSPQTLTTHTHHTH